MHCFREGVSFLFPQQTKAVDSFQVKWIRLDQGRWPESLQVISINKGYSRSSQNLDISQIFSGTPNEVSPTDSKKQFGENNLHIHKSWGVWVVFGYLVGGEMFDII